MTLDIEHYMKGHLNRAMTDDGADGKEVLDLLFAHERVRKERMLEERFDPSGSEAAVERMKAIADRLDGVGGNERAKLFLEMLHIAEDQTLGIDPEHLERSVSYLGDSNYTRDLANKYGRREDMYRLELPGTRLLRGNHRALQVLLLRPQEGTQPGGRIRQAAPVPREGPAQRGRS